MMGPGLLESAYEDALCSQLSKIGLNFFRQVPIGFVLDGLKIDCCFRADVIVEEKVILELKAVEKVLPLHRKQLLTYLKLSGLKLGLLLNFDVEWMKEGISRLVNGL